MEFAMRTLSRPIGMVARTLRTAAASQCVRSELQQCRHASTTPTTELVINSPMADLPLPRSISLAEFMLDDLLKHGSLPALVSAETGSVTSYAQLADAVVRVASGLWRQGTRQGDVVTLFSTNCEQFAVAYLALSAVGAVVSTLNPSYTSDELYNALLHSKSTMLVCSGDVVQVAKQAAKRANQMKVLVFGREAGCQSFSDLLQDDGRCFPENLSYDTADDLAALPYSSGTTGLPKGVMLTHDNIVSNIEQIRTDDVMPLVAGEDSLLAVLPWYHIYGQVLIMLTGFKMGCKITTMTAFKPELFLKMIEQQKVTNLHIVPPLMLFLAQHPLVDSYDTSSLDTIFTGAAPSGPESFEAVRDRLRLPRIRQLYGLTETSPLTHLNPREGYRYDTVGCAIHNTRYKVVDLDSGAALGPGKEGEVCIHGPQVMKGYLDNEAATADMIHDGWLRTGDIGYYKDDGHLVISDRLKELIKYKGFQVAPAELEALLLTHPAVSDAAVIGKPDERAGELPRAYVVLKAGSRASERDLAAFVAGKVGPNKHLRGGVEFRDSIPKTASGKILRQVLKAELKAAS